MNWRCLGIRIRRRGWDAICGVLGRRSFRAGRIRNTHGLIKVCIDRPTLLVQRSVKLSPLSGDLALPTQHRIDERIPRLAAQLEGPGITYLNVVLDLFVCGLADEQVPTELLGKVLHA